MGNTHPQAPTPDSQADIDFRAWMNKTDEEGKRQTDVKGVWPPFERMYHFMLMTAPGSGPSKRNSPVADVVKRELAKVGAGDLKWWDPKFKAYYDHYLKGTHFTLEETGDLPYYMTGLTEKDAAGMSGWNGQNRQREQADITRKNFFNNFVGPIANLVPGPVGTAASALKTINELGENDTSLVDGLRGVAGPTSDVLTTLKPRGRGFFKGGMMKRTRSTAHREKEDALAAAGRHRPDMARMLGETSKRMHGDAGMRAAWTHAIQEKADAMARVQTERAKAHSAATEAGRAYAETLRHGAPAPVGAWSSPEERDALEAARRAFDKFHAFDAPFADRQQDIRDFASGVADKPADASGAPAEPSSSALKAYRAIAIARMDAQDAQDAADGIPPRCLSADAGPAGMLHRPHIPGPPHPDRDEQPGTLYTGPPRGAGLAVEGGAASLVCRGKSNAGAGPTPLGPGIAPPPINATLLGDPTGVYASHRASPASGSGFQDMLHGKGAKWEAAKRLAKLPAQARKDFKMLTSGGDMPARYASESTLNRRRIKGGEPLPMALPQGSQQKLEEVGRFPDLPASGVLLYNFGEHPEETTEPIGPKPNKRKRLRGGVFKRDTPWV